MLFEKIESDIKKTANVYEQERNISTEKVYLLDGGKDAGWAIFAASKSDGTTSIFYAYKHVRSRSEDGWRWFCPSEEHIDGFKKVVEEYHRVNFENVKVRNPRLSRTRKRMSEWM